MKANQLSPVWLLAGIMLAFILTMTAVYAGTVLTKVSIQRVTMATDSTTTRQDGIDEKPYAAAETDAI